MNEELFEKLLKNIRNEYLKGEINLDELMEESINLGNIKTTLDDEKSRDVFLKMLGELYLKQMFGTDEPIIEMKIIKDKDIRFY